MRAIRFISSVLGTGLFGAVVAYIVRRNQLFSPARRD